MLSLPSAVPLVERRTHGGDGHVAAVEVGVLVDFRHRRGSPQPGGRLDRAGLGVQQRRVGPPIDPWTVLPEAADGHVDQAGVAGRKGVIAKPSLP